MEKGSGRRLWAWSIAALLSAHSLQALGQGCESSAAPVPVPEELERHGTKVGIVEIQVEDVFDPSKSGESALPYRLANDLHLRTRQDFVRSQLLFHESDTYSRQKVAETERLLRGRRYLYDAWIEATCYYPDSETVDLKVRVRDVWSLNPGLNFNRKGGANHYGFEVEDQDFLGRGELVSASWGRNVDRDTILLVYDDPQVLGTWWRGRVAYADNSDGNYGEFDLGRPFYSLDTRWSAGLRTAAGDWVESRYQRGTVLDAFTVNSDRFEIYGGTSSGLNDGRSHRWLAGVRYEDSRFSETSGDDLQAPLPEDRKLVYPWVGMEWLEDDFVTVHNQDQLARTEDLQFGESFRAEIGLAAPAWGADRTAAIARFRGDGGTRLGEAHSLLYSGEAGARLESGGVRDATLTAEARYYHRQSPHVLLFASARGSLVERPDLDHQLLLGGDNGLRGYPLRYQSGTGSALLTVEERFYTDWFPFHLFNVGAAAFADAGRTWGLDFAGAEPLGLLADAGIGLRIGNSRSGLGNVLHIDVAVPLARQDGIDAVQFLVETKHSF